jgi:spore coat polysaccharide biosynthesis predicted glycosyltransferase SpsG
MLIVADAGRRAGLGHLARCTAIAVALSCRGVDTRCLALGAEAPLVQDGIAWEAVESAERIPPAPAPVLLLDSYRVPPAALRARLDVGALALMHDRGQVPDGAALVITSDHELSDGRLGVIGGPRMTCLRPAFWGLPDEPPTPASLRRVLVATGGGDPGGHAIPVAERVRSTLPEAEVRLVRGPYAHWEAPPGIATLDRPASLLEALLEADLVVTAAGQALYEAMAAGTATIALPLAENQRAAARAFELLGATEVVEPDALEALGQRLERLDEHPAECGVRARRARVLVDGYGALRVAHRLTRLAPLAGRASDGGRT